MCNIYDVILDCRELLEISQQSQVSQTERIRTKSAFDVWKHIRYVRESTFSTMKQVKAVKAKNRNQPADETPHHSLRLATTNVLVLLSKR